MKRQPNNINTTKRCIRPLTVRFAPFQRRVNLIVVLPVRSVHGAEDVKWEMMTNFKWRLPNNWPRQLLTFILWFIVALAFSRLPERIQLYILVPLFIGGIAFLILSLFLVFQHVKVNRAKQEKELRQRFGSKYDIWFGKGTD